MTLFPVIFREKAAMILITLLRSKKALYVSTLSKKVNYTYSHVVKVLKEMEQGGLISFEKHGRLKLLELTEKGKEVALEIEKIREML